MLGFCNIGLFFPLIFLAAYHLPGGLAATVQATSPLAVMAMAWPLIRERPGLVRVGRRPGRARWCLAARAAVARRRRPRWAWSAPSARCAVSRLGFVLVKRWPPPVPMLTLVSWQLVAGGLVLLPVALLVEGAPPPVDLPAAAASSGSAIVGTILAYTCWFHGLSRLPAGAVSLVGLLNPVMGTVLGIAFAGELFGWAQALGMAAGARRGRGSDSNAAAPR